MSLSRRRLLDLLAHGSLAAIVVAASGPLLGRGLYRRWRPRRPTDLPPIPWIGHC